MTELVSSEASLTPLRESRLVAVVTLEDPALARPMGDAMKAGGLRCIEVTLRNDAAEESIRQLTHDPELFVGAGTVRTKGQLERVVRAGAQFVVSPGLDPALLTHARRLDVPFVPGISTATELQRATKFGQTCVKLFPAEPIGGLPVLDALSRAFPDVMFLPTGGISEHHLRAYLKHPSVIAVGGSWMASPGLLHSGQSERITELAAAAVHVVRTSRSEAQ